MLFRRKQRYSLAEVTQYVDDLRQVESLYRTATGEDKEQYRQALHVMREVLQRIIEGVGHEELLRQDIVKEAEHGTTGNR